MTENKNMTSLRSVLSHNIKEQRHRLEITQAELAERVDTSTHYICMVETCKKFPTPEMLERIAAALEFDAPELFSTKTYPFINNKPMDDFEEKVMNDISKILYHRVRELKQDIQSTAISKPTTQT
ncbi:MAG: helix-turn-helix transcriptional regulator [Treponema sp.]|nr:helix-turn-helix transcriptional regulator [Treponema sp.]